MPIDPQATVVQLTEQLAVIGADSLLKCVSNLNFYLDRCVPQPKEGVSLGTRNARWSSIHYWVSIRIEVTSSSCNVTNHVVHYSYCYWMISVMFTRLFCSTQDWRSWISSAGLEYINSVRAVQQMARCAASLQIPDRFPRRLDPIGRHGTTRRPIAGHDQSAKKFQRRRRTWKGRSRSRCGRSQEECAFGTMPPALGRFSARLRQ